MNHYCIIPARGGSKRIPRKNIKLFNGKPIISYAIEAALNSGCFKRVIVSTDDDEIADIAQRFGAWVPFKRPQELSNDYCGTLEVINHAIEWLLKNNYPVDYVCTLYGTAPFVQPSNLKQALSILQQTQDKDYCFAVCEYPVPIQQAFSIDEAKNITMFQPDQFGKRTQDLTPAYFDAGQFYWGKTSAFLAEYSMFSAHAIPYILPKHEVHDIDTLDDWILAEAMFNALKQVK